MLFRYTARNWQHYMIRSEFLLLPVYSRYGNPSSRYISLRFRGSRNQRLIDMNKTRAAGKIVLWDDEMFPASRK